MSVRLRPASSEVAGKRKAATARHPLRPFGPLSLEGRGYSASEGCRRQEGEGGIDPVL
jgi:hypothetical protein